MKKTKPEKNLQVVIFKVKCVFCLIKKLVEFGDNYLSTPTTLQDRC